MLLWGLKMADLSNVFGGPWSPPPEKRVAPPEEQLLDAIRDAGLEPPEQVILDGKIHRFKSGTKGAPGHGDKPGWYLVFGDGVPAGRFGCWRAGVEVTWRADVGRKLTQTEEMAHARRMAEAKALRDAELERKHQVASETPVTTMSMRTSGKTRRRPICTRQLTLKASSRPQATRPGTQGDFHCRQRVKGSSSQNQVGSLMSSSTGKWYQTALGWPTPSK